MSTEAEAANAAAQDELNPERARKRARAAATLDRYEAAKAEHRAMQAWKQSGERGARPQTPNLDALNNQEPIMEAATTTATRGPKLAVVFTIDGKRTDDRTRRYTLGYVAFENTAGIGGPDVKRITTEELRKVLAGLGVTNPETEAGWEVELPNGKKVGAVAPDAALAAAGLAAKSEPKPKAERKPAAAKAAPAKAAAAKATKKGPAKKAAPAKARATRKPVGAKADVVPNFKAPKAAKAS